MTRHIRSRFRTSRHARARMQGRAIRAKALDLVLDYGTEERACGHRTLLRLDRDLRIELERDHPDLRRHLDIYAILESEAIVTVCHDTGHLRRRLH